MRQCGECSLCCKLLHVEELKKPAHTWCPHVQLGKGCSIYPDRPTVCQEFECMWKMDFVREELGPLRTKVVGKIGSSKFGETVYLFEDVEGNARTHFQTYINMWTERGFAVIIIYKNRRTAILPKGRI